MQEAACLLLLMHGKYFGSPAAKDVGDIQMRKKATLALRKKFLSFVRKCRGHSNLQGGNFNIKKQTFFGSCIGR